MAIERSAILRDEVEEGAVLGRKRNALNEKVGS